jgi:ABC-type lipoprotein export system ATPase subunit
MPDKRTLLELVTVTKTYGAVGDADTAILKGIDLRVAPGESLAVVGPSGSGKTTLLNVMGALDRPTSGRALVDGTDLAQLDDRALARFRNRRIGFVFQLHHLLPQCSVLENVLVPSLVNEDAEDTDERARRLLERVGLTARLSYRPGQLSGGERQRVAVVRALVNKPDLLLADEPTGSLDHAGAESLGRLLLDLNREEGVTLIVVTHSTRLAEKMGRMLQLQDGVLRGTGA